MLISKDSNSGVHQHLRRLATSQQEKAANFQQSTNFMSRAVWVAKDREAYKSAVLCITKSNDLIESILRSHVLRAIHRGPPQGRKPTETKPKSYTDIPHDDRLCIQSLACLSEALPELKLEPESTRKFEYGLRIAFNHHLTKESVSTDFRDLPLQADSSVYLLQANSFDDQTPSDSSLLLAEHCHVSVQDHSLLVPQQDLESFQWLENISLSTASPSILRLFKDKTSWRESTSLADLLGDSSGGPAIKMRIGLAALLAKSYLHISGLNNQVGISEPENFKFFDVSSEAGSISSQDIMRNEGLLLNIYHFFSLAKKPPKVSTRSLGAKVTTKSAFDSSVISLGLLLYYVACWKRPSAKLTGDGVSRENMELKQEAYGNIHELYRKVGLRFAEIVQSCLEWDCHLPQSQMMSVTTFYHEVVTPLLELRADARKSLLM